MSFWKAIKRHTDKAEMKLESTFREASFEVARRVIMRTPVGDPSYWKGRAPSGYSGGRLRANWQANINRIPKGSIEKTDGSGNATMTAVRAEAARLRIGDKFYCVNNLPYAKVIENGHSRRQAPQGMVKITVQEWRNIVKLVTGVF